MSEERRFWLSFWAMTFTFLAATIMTCTALCCRHIQRMAEQGYQEEMAPGRQYPVWRKVAQPQVLPGMMYTPAQAVPL